eukprot:11034965-Ditylum_brightwellii.AAC.1
MKYPVVNITQGLKVLKKLQVRSKLCRSKHSSQYWRRKIPLQLKNTTLCLDAMIKLIEDQVDYKGLPVKIEALKTADEDDKS